MCDQYPAYAFWRSKISLTVRSADASPPDHISSLQFMPGVFGRTHISSTFDARFHGLGFENWCRRCICATSVHLLPIPVLEPIGKYLGKCLGNDRDQSWPSGGGVRPLFSHTGHPIALVGVLNLIPPLCFLCRGQGHSSEGLTGLRNTRNIFIIGPRSLVNEHVRRPISGPIITHRRTLASSIPQQLSTEATS